MKTQKFCAFFGPIFYKKIAFFLNPRAKMKKFKKMKKMDFFDFPLKARGIVYYDAPCTPLALDRHLRIKT